MGFQSSMCWRSTYLFPASPCSILTCTAPATERSASSQPASPVRTLSLYMPSPVYSSNGAHPTEINAATTISSLVASPSFDFSRTYWLIAGIAGVNPEVATLGSVTFAKYAVQVALQYEFDAREMPANFTTGYVPLGATAPGEYPTSIYGTEVFEVNEALRDTVRAIYNVRAYR